MDCILSVLSQASPRVARVLMRAAMTAASLVCLSATGWALSVGTQSLIVPDTSNNPASTSGWTKGDPGWANAAHNTDFLNGVYIGDGWILSAFHAGASGVNFVDNGPVYQPIPNQVFRLQNADQSYADLQLYRVETDLNLPSLKIASQPLALNDEVLFEGWSRSREALERHWNVTNNPNPNYPPTWTETTPTGLRNGYNPGLGSKHWGSNQVANADCVLNGVCNGSLRVVKNSGAGPTMLYVTTYDQQNPVTGNAFEAQVTGGDSGSAVFNKRSGQWELAGIVVANYYWPGQSVYWDVVNNGPRPVGYPPDFNPSNGIAAYGNASAFADLSTYASQIDEIRTAPDINLDGIVSGDGTGATASDDIAAFVAGWGYDNNLGYGTMTSWRKGDISGPNNGIRDGKTDVYDFLRMRSKLNSAGAAAALGDLLSNAGGGVPEPSAVMLVVVPATFLALRGRYRRPRRAI